MNGKTKWAGWCLMVALLLSVTVWRQWPDSAIHLIMCDVGQGDAFLITQGFSQLLIDTGTARSGVLSCLGQHLPFWDKHLEVVVVSHSDSDHAGGLGEVLRSYRVGEVVTTHEAEQFVADIVKERSKMHTVWFGQSWQWGRVYSEVLWPEYSVTNKLNLTKTDTNYSSMVMRVTITGKQSSNQYSVWFSGDAGEDVEAELVKNGRVQPVSLLKVAHHGAKTATSEPFLAILRPRQAWISVGKQNRYGHPGREVLDRLQKNGSLIWRTDKDGNAETVID